MISKHLLSSSLVAATALSLMPNAGLANNMAHDGTNVNEANNYTQLNNNAPIQQRKDSVVEKGSDRGIMLNAKSTTEPRQVEIGLPMNYTAVMFNGLPSVFYYWPNTTSNHWRSEQLLARQGMLDMPHVAIIEGEIGYGVDSWAELGGDKFKGKMKYSVNTFGSQNVDLNLSGPLGKGWSFTASAYNNFDPGCFNLKFAQFVDRSQFYTAGLTKRWNDGSSLTFMYKYNDVHNLTSLAKYAPFRWNSDGSVSKVNGFRIGRDSYLPVDGMMEYIDMESGERKQTNLFDGIHVKTHEGSVYFSKPLQNDWTLNLRGRMTNSSGWTGDQVATSVLNTEDGVTAKYADTGDTYTGLIQGRTSQLNHICVTDGFFNALLVGKKADHSWTVGVDELFTNVRYARSTTAYYHEVAANPRKLLINGATSPYSNFNNGSEYDKGFENKLAAYVFDKWEPTHSFRLSYGARFEWSSVDVDDIANPRATWTGADGTQHYFQIGGTDKDGKTITQVNHKQNGLNFAFAVAPKWNITDNFGLTAEGNFLRQFRHLEAYSGRTAPMFKSRDSFVGQAGVFYNSSWVNLVSALTYATRNNNVNNLYVTNPDNPTQTEMVANSFTIKTLGWTTDAMLNLFKGFQLHARVTLQAPKYSGYSFSTSWKEYNFKSMTVTKISKFLMELDPRYSVGPFAIWANFRYYGKQYVNVGNSVFFKGRWETFGGMSYNCNKNLTLSANVTNFLGQSGAQGTIPSADTREDATGLDGTVLAGEYILPFQVSFSANIKF